MPSISQSTNDLVSAIRQTPEFADFRRAESALSQDRDSFSKVQNFEQRNASIMSGNYSPQQVEAILRESNRKYEALLKVPVIKTFFESGERFHALMGRIVRDINTGVER